MTAPPSRQRSPHVRCTVCGAMLPGWLPVPAVPDGALLRGHLKALHRQALTPYLERMATENIGTVAVEAFERVEAP